MDRRTFLKSTGAAAVAGTAATTADASGALNDRAPLTSAPASGKTSGHYVLRTRLPLDDGAPGMAGAMHQLVRFFNEIGDPDFAIRVETLDAGPRNPLTALGAGQSDICVHFAGALGSGDPALDLIADGPLADRPGALHAWLNGGGGQPLWDDLAAEQGLKPFLLADLHASGGWWSRAPLRLEGGLAGHRLVGDGASARALARLGAELADLDETDTGEALRGGAVTLVQGRTGLFDMADGLPAICSHFTIAPWAGKREAMVVSVNLKAWEKLGARAQGALRGAIAHVGRCIESDVQAHQAMAWHAVGTRHGIARRHLPDMAARRLRAARDGVLEEIASASDMAARIYESQRGFLAALDVGQSPMGPALS